VQVSVFWDLDGCLADFVRGCFAFHGKSLPYDEVQWDFDKQLELTPEEFWSPLGYEFWKNLPVLNDGAMVLNETVATIGLDNIGVLTSPCQTAGCVDGKLDWIRSNFPYLDRKVLVGSAKYLCSGPGRILIDDLGKNIEAWEASGGVGILYPQPWNANKGKKIDLGKYRRYLCRFASDGNLTAQDFYV
jgi:5'(3')-deoxyribonucleotidase